MPRLTVDYGGTQKLTERYVLGERQESPPTETATHHTMAHLQGDHR